MLFSVYLNEHLNEIKRIAEPTKSLLELASISRPELDTSQTDCFIADRDILLCQQVLDITEAQIESVVDPYDSDKLTS